MIDLAKAVLPSSVEAGGGQFRVRTWFKDWLRFLALCNERAPLRDFDFMYVDGAPEDRQSGLDALVAFCDPPQEIPRTDGRGGKVLDYAADADYIYAAFMERYGIDLVQGLNPRTGEPLHWYEFSALLRGLGGTKLNEIIGYRLWENDGRRHDEYTRQMERLKAAWSLPDDAGGHDGDLEEFEALLEPRG